MFAVTGGKGGVGKTTTALGVAAALARDGHRPAVVDADLDTPNLAAMAGVDGLSLDSIAVGDSLSVAPTVAGVTVVGAQPGTAISTLEACLERLDALDRPVLLDCPAGTGRAHGVALRAASQSVLVTRPTRRAVTDVLKSATLARRLGAPPTRLVVTGTREVSESIRTTAIPDAVPLPPAGASPAWRVDTRRFDGIVTLE